jgi:hypothetical protein
MLESAVICNVKPCASCKNWRFGEKYHSIIRVGRISEADSSNLIMDVLLSSETSVLKRATRSHISDGILYSHRHENRRSNKEELHRTVFPTQELLIRATVYVKLFIFVRFEVLTAVTIKNGVFWHVTLCGSYKNRRLGEIYRLHHQGDKNRWNSHRHENFKSYTVLTA